MPTPHPTPRFRDVRPMYIEDTVHHTKELKDWDSEPLMTGIARTFSDPSSWLPDLFQFKRENLAACFLGTSLGSLVAALCVPATMKISIFPGTSQIVIILTFAAFKWGVMSKLMGWADLAERGRKQFLLILQSSGSAPTGPAMGALVSLPLGLILERSHRERNMKDWMGTTYKNTEYRESDSLDMPYILLTMLACIGGSLTGAAWTNINMATELKKDYPAPEAHASSSLIRTFSKVEKEPEALEGPSSGGAGEAAPAPGRGGKSAMWLLPSFGVGTMLVLFVQVVCWLGVFPAEAEFTLYNETYAKSLHDTNNAFYNQLEQAKRNYAPNSTAGETESAFKELASRMPSFTLVAGLAAVAYETSSKILKKQVFGLDPASFGVHVGVGGLVSFRSGTCMFLGAIILCVIHYCHPIFMERSVTTFGENITLDQFQEGIGTAQMWCTNDAAYKWIAISMIFVNTAYSVTQLFTGGGASQAATAANAETPTSLRKKSWVNPFNFLCLSIGYVLTLVFLLPLPGYPSNGTPLSKLCMLIITFVFDYVCNQVGGQQSLLLGGSNSPVSACLYMAVIALTFVRFLEKRPGDIGYDVGAEAADYKILGVWCVRLFTSICYTNDAAQDYATTQIMEENIYLATRENLMSSLFASVTMPLSLWFFICWMPETGHLGATEGGGYATVQAAAMSVVHEGIMNGGVPYYSVAFGVGSGLLGVFLAQIGAQRPHHTDSRFRSTMLWLLKDFNITSVALGIYLGTELSFGIFLGGLAFLIGAKLKGAGGGNKSKEVYLMVVGYLTGNALGQFVQVGWMFYGLVKGPDSLAIDQASPLFGTLTAKGTDAVADSWQYSWTGMSESSQALWMAPLIMAIGAASITGSQLWGHELEASPAVLGDDSDDEDDVPQEMQDLLAAEREFQLGPSRTENGVVNDDEDLAADWKQADEAVFAVEAKLGGLRKKRAHAQSNALGRHVKEGFAKRQLKDAEANRSRYTMGMFGVFGAMVALAVFSYIKGTQENMEWSKWTNTWMNEAKASTEGDLIKLREEYAADPTKHIKAALEKHKLRKEDGAPTNASAEETK